MEIKNWLLAHVAALAHSVFGWVFLYHRNLIYAFSVILAFPVKSFYIPLCTPIQTGLS